MSHDFYGSNNQFGPAFPKGSWTPEPVSVCQCFVWSLEPRNSSGTLLSEAAQRFRSSAIVSSCSAAPTAWTMHASKISHRVGLKKEPPTSQCPWLAKFFWLWPEQSTTIYSLYLKALNSNTFQLMCPPPSHWWFVLLFSWPPLANRATSPAPAWHILPMPKIHKIPPALKHIQMKKQNPAHPMKTHFLWQSSLTRIKAAPKSSLISSSSLQRLACRGISRSKSPSSHTKKCNYLRGCNDASIRSPSLWPHRAFVVHVDVFRPPITTIHNIQTNPPSSVSYGMHTE